MTAKSEFDAEQWERITEAPPLAAMVVITAQRGGTIRESMAVGKAYSEAREQQSGTPLLDEVVDSLPAIKPESFENAEQLHARALDRIGAAIDALEEKGTGEEAQAYREFVLALIQRVAEADKSGGFLGIGGERVSSSESQAIDEIRAALT